MFSLKTLWAGCFVAAMGVAGAASAATVVTIEAPGVSNASITNSAVETFDNFALGGLNNTAGAIGTYSGGVTTGPGIYGGTGTSQYLFVQNGTTTLTLNSPARYFGLWWSAVNAGNQVHLLSGGQRIFSFHTQDFISYINGPDGDPSYFGQPGTGANTREPYAFLNFYADQTFDAVEFVGGNFESDNHTVAQQFGARSGTSLTAVPLPATLPLLAGVLGLGGWVAHRRKT